MFVILITFTTLIFHLSGLLVSGKSINNSEDNQDGVIPAVRDERNILTSEDKNPVLDLLDSDIKDIEGLKKKIEYLEKQLRKHADTNIVKGNDLVIEDYRLSFYEKTLKQYENNLIALKNLVNKTKHRFDDESLEEMINVVEKAESFFEKAELSIEHAEVVEQDWEAMEESKQIEEMIAKDKSNNEKKVDGQPISNISKSLQSLLFVDKAQQGYPVGKEGRLVVLSDDSKAEMKHKYHRVYAATLANKTNLEQAKVNLLQETKDKLEEEARSDIMKETVRDDPAEHYSPEVKEALAKAAEASRKFAQEKLVQEAHETHILPSVLPAMAALIFVCVVLGVIIFRRSKRVRRNSPRRNWRGQPSPPGQQVPDVSVQVDPPSGERDRSSCEGSWNNAWRDLVLTPSGGVRTRNDWKLK